jgi:GWxTD domain-containing protein
MISLPITTLPGSSQRISSKAPPQREKTRIVSDRLGYYQFWLEEDAAYIITDSERRAFLQLTNDSDRETFIEQFWLRRDPTPDTISNEFRDETYRRFAYANEHFGTRIRGWKSDRGKIYIIWGRPDSILVPPCPNPKRTAEEGAGFDDCFRSEIWHYNYVEGFGNNINLEFVDPAGDGDYRISVDDAEKKELFNSSESAVTDFDYAPTHERADSFSGSFTRIPPKFMDLAVLVTAGIVRNELSLVYRFDFERSTGYTTLTSLAVTIQPARRDGHEEGPSKPMHLNIYGRLTRVGGHGVEEFEDTILLTPPNNSNTSTNNARYEYQHTLALRPGVYSLDVGAKEVETDNVGITRVRIGVPIFATNRIDASSLIISNRIEPSQEFAPPTFGAYSMRLALNPTFNADQKAESFLQVYGLQLDRKTNLVSGSVSYRITQSGKEIWKATETLDELHIYSEQVALRRQIPLSSLLPGHYRIDAEVTDRIAHETLFRYAEFDVGPAIRQGN